MTQEEFQKAIKDLRAEYKRKEREIMESNSSYKIGDVVTDHIGTIKIDNIYLDPGRDFRSGCVFTGFVLKKSGKPKKARRRVWEAAVIS